MKAWWPEQPEYHKVFLLVSHSRSDIVNHHNLHLQTSKTVKAYPLTMEDLSAISVTEQNPFCVEMMKRLNIQRKQGHLCDITLITKDDQELMAHRNILSAASPFFRKERKKIGRGSFGSRRFRDLLWKMFWNSSTLEL